MTPDNISSELQALWAEGSFWQVEELARQTIESQPDQAIAYYYLAKCQLRDLAYEPALANIEKANELDPSNFEFRKWLAFAKQTYFDAQGAEPIYVQLLQENDQDPELQLFVGIYHAENGHPEYALQHFNRAIELQPNNWPAYYQRAKALTNQHEHQAALQDLQMLIEQDPDSTAQYRELRIAALKGLDDLPAVVQEYQQLIQLNEEQALYWNTELANFYRDHNKKAEAIETYSFCIAEEERLNEGVASALNYHELAQLYFDTDNLEQATLYNDKSLAVDEQYSDGLFLRANILREKGEYAAAIQALNQGLETMPFNKGEFYRLRGEIHQVLGQLDQALEDFQQWADESFQSAEAMTAIGRVHHAKGDSRAAYDAWSHAAQYSDEAQQLIDTHCQDITALEAQLEADQKAAEQEALRAQFEGEAAKNEQSAFMQPLFGTTWQIDLEAMQGNDLNMIPEIFRGMLQNMLQGINVSFSAESIKIGSPMGGDMEAFYRIEEETENSVKIYGHNGREPRTVNIQRKGDKLTLDGLMDGQMTGGGQLGLVLKQVIAPKDAAATQADLQAAIEQMMPTILQGFGDLVSSAFQQFTSGGGSHQSDTNEPEEEKKKD